MAKVAKKMKAKSNGHKETDASEARVAFLTKELKKTCLGVIHDKRGTAMECIRALNLVIVQMMEEP